MNRGDRREALFEDDRDRQRFLETLGEACGKTGWQVQAYCLMDNHFHLVLQTPQANLVAGMKWLLGTYTSRFNRRQDSEAGRRAFARAMEQRRKEELEEEFLRVERAWYLGDDEFRQELLEQASVRRGSSHYGEIVHEDPEGPEDGERKRSRTENCFNSLSATAGSR